MTVLLRDPNTGIVYGYTDDGILLGPIISFPDPPNAPQEPSENLWDTYRKKQHQGDSGNKQ